LAGLVCAFTGAPNSCLKTWFCLTRLRFRKIGIGIRPVNTALGEDNVPLVILHNPYCFSNKNMSHPEFFEMAHVSNGAGKKNRLPPLF
jgi:hypothetical protein